MEEERIMLDVSSDKEKVLETFEKEVIQTKHWFCEINKEILPAKLCYLFDVGRKMMTNAMLILFLVQSGLQKDEVGFMMGFRCVKVNETKSPLYFSVKIIFSQD